MGHTSTCNARRTARKCPWRAPGVPRRRRRQRCVCAHRACRRPMPAPACTSSRHSSISMSATMWALRLCALAASAGGVVGAASIVARPLSAPLAGASASDTVMIEWAADPVRPGETLLLNGMGFSNSSRVFLRYPDNHTVEVRPSYVASHRRSLAFSMPANELLSVVLVRVVNANTSLRAPVSMGAANAGVVVAANEAQPWWWLGDLGNCSRAGGTVRVFGKNFLMGEKFGREQQLRRDAVAAAHHANYSEALRLQREADAVHPRGAVSLQLLQGGVVSHEIVASAATEFDARFSLPPSVTVGEYKMAIKNNLDGASFVPISFLASPQPGDPYPRQMHLLSVVSTPSIELAASARVFHVPAPEQLPPRASADDIVAAALASARSAGGGTVQFAAAKYYLNGPILVPNGVLIRGVSSALTSVHFKAANVTSEAPAAYLCSEHADSEFSTWHIEDIGIYVAGAHNDIIVVTNTTDRFRMRRVLVRANARFGGNEDRVFGNKHTQQDFDQDAGGGHYGAVVRVHGTNFEISDCDLYGTACVIETQNGWNSSHTHYDMTAEKSTAWTMVHGAWWGMIKNNVIFNGGASHRMNIWNQIAFVNNTIVGVGLLAMGQAWGTGPTGGVSAHIFHAHNSIQHVYGNDREVMTVDDAGGAYFGPVDVDGMTLTLHWDPQPGGHMNANGVISPFAGPPFASNGWAGAEVVIVNGTGAGQTRRVIEPGIWRDYTPNNRTWVIDRPFLIAPGSDSWLEIQPYRGRTHFFDNDYKDVGAFQLYGHSTEVIVAQNRGERMTGWFQWGQWRGFFQPIAPGLLGGSFGVGANPSLKILMLGNRHSDQGIVNYALKEKQTPGYGQDAWWEACPLAARDSPFTNTTPGGNGTAKHPLEPYPNLPAHKPDLCMNCLAVYRNNVVSDGGMWFGWFASEIVAENNRLGGRFGKIRVDTESSVLLRGNDVAVPSNSAL